MTEQTSESSVSHLANISVETNAPSAPVEQQSAATKPEPEATDSVVTETTATEPAKAETEVKAESVKAETQEPTIDEKENERARLLIEARIRAEKAEGELKALKPAEKPLGDRPVMPLIENFDTYENFLTALKSHDKAVDEWNDRRISAAVEKQTQERITRTESERLANADRISVATKEEVSRTKHKDYDVVIAPMIPLIREFGLLKDFIAKNPMGTEVVYELAKNPAILEQLTRMNVWDAGEKLLSMASQLKKPVSIKPTNTPDPIKPVGTNEVAKVKMSTLPIADYFEARKKQEMKARHLN